MDERKDKPKSDNIKKLERELLEAIIDNPYECPVIIDVNGIVRFLSHYSKELIGIDPNWAIGRHVSEVFKETNLHEVVETGRAKIGETLFIAGRYQIISRIPLRNRKGKIVGAVGKGMFYHASKVTDLHKRLELMDNQLSYLIKEMHLLKKSRALIGQSDLMQHAKKMALEVSESNISVHITGESGTGKEALAYYIHEHSRRSDAPFIRVNCAAIPPELIESELFGYVAGAFSGARSQGKPGKFELANGGTILLDEIGDMSLAMQAKLLRVLQEHEVERLGSNKMIPLDYRLITSTNRNLPEMMEKGFFRNDLYYRINTFHINTPALREIPDDIPLITCHLMSLLKEEISSNTRSMSISTDAMLLLKQYYWPGNVRELNNVLERALILSKGQQIVPEHLPVKIVNHGKSTAQSGGTYKNTIEDAEKRLIEKTMSSAGGNKAKAARILGLTRPSLYRKMRYLGLKCSR